ncbi:DNA replication ATP-dependent helicase/nuclease DNA2 [Orchesella cincta]|uniref:DNA helicase n=1 Tax=Orchesella cincta TaxID=48709 RepID=A0A1D2MGZ4_ORCCI|nr:DNA replication ATP-dependent helicase/nuclease DNA2 [Orchesella cincta]
MTDRLDSLTDLKKEAKTICTRPQMLERAYGIGLTDDELEKLQTSVAEWVARFMRVRFFGPADGKHNNFNFMDVLGVEDNIWTPTFGLKGKIDATVLIKKDGQLMTTPLEFKTGSTKSQKRQPIKSDHVGQVSLYTLMMSTKYGPIQEALLYYISDDSMSIHPPRNLELQQLLMNRNKLVRSTTLSEGDLPYLPRPDGIDYEFKCKTCEVRNICTLQIRKNKRPENELMNTEKALLANCNLSDEEFDFFEQWMKVINAETEEVEKRYNDKNLWTLDPEVREGSGTCIANLKLVGDSVPWEDSCGKAGFLASFEKKGSSSQFLANLKVNDFIALSSNVEVCINYGVIVSLRDNEITLFLDQTLHKEYKSGNFTYSVDKINTTSPIASQYGYLMKLMNDTPEAERLRQYIIMKKQPNFKKLLLPDPQLQQIVNDLNTEQSRLNWKSQSTDSFLFVKGTPGSGKTASIVRLLKALVYAKKSVLVVSYTGMALEHILKKFKEDNDEFIKINSSSAAEDSLRSHTTKELSNSVTSIAELTELYNKPVVGTTLLSLKHPIFQVRRFDYCIVDEASQALPTAVFEL